MAPGGMFTDELPWLQGRDKELVMGRAICECLQRHGHEVLTDVVDRGPNVPGRDFDITKALADRLGLHGTQTIKWRFAR